MGQGGQEDRLAEVAPASRLRSVAPPLGGRKNLRVAVPQPPHEQGLREIVLNRRGVRLRSHDALDGKTVSPCLGIFKQSLEEEFSEVSQEFIGNSSLLASVGASDYLGAELATPVPRERRLARGVNTRNVLVVVQ